MMNEKQPSPHVHPRRRPSHLSVSLRHQATTPLSTDDGPRKVKGGKRVDQATRALKTSDESNDSREWFDHFNNHPDNAASQNYKDNEPPFFLRPNSSHDSNNTPPQHGPSTDRLQSHVQTLPKYSTGESGSSKSYRSVIDDLTTKNKRLKAKLRRNEVRLEKDMLEIKFHPAFPANKRKELEDMIRNFMMATNNSSAGDSSMNTPSNLKTENSASDDGSQSPSSHSTVDSRPLDSGFQSMSKPGSNSASKKYRLRLEQKFGSQQPNVKDHDVESFLKNIPPDSHIGALTEKQKKKIVVRRLEELFIGKRGIIPGEHSQPMQQQEVSNSAARYDREHDHIFSTVEGIREAHILPFGTDIDAIGSGKLSSELSSDSEKISKDNLGLVNEGPSSPEQRPTRPMDLDPDRAQIPADNVDYIRHLGLPTPQLVQQDSADVEADAEGWIYLNLLINLAQLHIINVTPDFVRTAVADVSDKFQISLDGQKLRWRGGADGTRLSSESEVSSLRQSPQDSDGLGKNRRRKRKAAPGRLATLPIENSYFTVPVRGGKKESLHYRPMFNHRTTSSSSSSVSSDVSVYAGSDHVKATKPSESNIHSRGSGSNPRAKRPRNGGPILFYSGAQFFTDLSGDRSFLNNPHVNEVGFDNQASCILGSDLSKSKSIARTDSGSSLLTRPFKDYSRIPPFSKSSKESDDDRIDLGFSPEWSLESSSPANQLQPLTASGVGGTQPADHFSVEVETVRTILKGDCQPATPKQFSSTLSLNSSRRRSANQSLPVKTLYSKIQLSKLDPSPLPAPAGFYSEYTSSAGTELTSSISDSLEPHPDLTLLSHSIRNQAADELDQDSGEMEESEDGEDDIDDDDENNDNDDDEESIDMLAEERLKDPTIAIKEAEFDRLTRRHRHKRNG